MSIKKWYPSRYLEASDVKEDEVVTIQKITEEAVGPTQEIKPVIYFHEHTKGVILNKTNATVIAKLYGDDEPEADWLGKTVSLFTEMVRNPQTGERGPAIRVQAPPKKKATKKGAALGAALDDEIPFN
jgi:hypothetical protein